MSEDPRHQVIEWLRDWSKWLISVNFAAAVGCTVVLQTGVRGPSRLFLLLAIGAFALSIVISITVVRALSTAVEDLQEPGRERASVLDQPLLAGLSVRAATRLQLLSLVAGVLFFVAWVALKPAPPLLASAAASALSVPGGAVRHVLVRRS